MWVDIPGTADSAVIGHSYGGATVRVRLRWTTQAVATSLVVLVLAGCADSTPPTPTGSSATTTERTVADPEAVLNQLATELRTRIETLTAGLKTTYRGVTGNQPMVCRVPNGHEWPQQWNYAQRLFLTEPDSRGTARQLAEKLRADGWTVATHLDTATDLELTIQKDGAVISINAWSSGGGLAVVGDSACVNADGTVDHRPVG